MPSIERIPHSLQEFLFWSQTLETRKRFHKFVLTFKWSLGIGWRLVEIAVEKSVWFAIRHFNGWDQTFPFSSWHKIFDFGESPLNFFFRFFSYNTFCFTIRNKFQSKMQLIINSVNHWYKRWKAWTATSCAGLHWVPPQSCRPLRSSWVHRNMRPKLDHPIEWPLICRSLTGICGNSTHADNDCKRHLFVGVKRIHRLSDISCIWWNRFGCR